MPKSAGPSVSKPRLKGKGWVAQGKRDLPTLRDVKTVLIRSMQRIPDYRLHDGMQEAIKVLEHLIEAEENWHLLHPPGGQPHNWGLKEIVDDLMEGEDDLMEWEDD